MTRFARPHATSHRPHVVVAGGGVAALETCLALRAFGGGRFRVTMVAPNATFVHRPAGAPDALATRSLRRVALSRLATAAGADLLAARLVAVDRRRHKAFTTGGNELSYDALVVAIGGTIYTALPGAPTVDDPAEEGRLRLLLDSVRRGTARSVAFVVPPAPAWRLHLYELAIQAAVVARSSRPPAAITVVTCEDAPLGILGSRVAGAVSHTLASHGVHVRRATYVRSLTQGSLSLAPGGEHLDVDSVAAAAGLRGPALPGLPHDRDGFLPADRFGRVPGAPDVYAAGDCTAFPVKHASIAGQQADASASAIAASLGVAVEPAPFKPILRCMLPARLRWYAEAPITGGCGDAARVSPEPLWPPAARFASRFLSPVLAAQDTAQEIPARAALDEVRRAFRRLEGARP